MTQNNHVKRNSSGAEVVWSLSIQEFTCHIIVFHRMSLLYKSSSSYLGPQDAPVYVGAEDGSRRKQSRVRRWHHSSSHTSSTNNGDVGRCEVLQGDWQGQSGFSSLIRSWRTIGGLVPIWCMDIEVGKTEIHCFWNAKDILVLPHWFVRWMMQKTLWWI